MSRPSKASAAPTPEPRSTAPRNLLTTHPPESIWRTTLGGLVSILLFVRFYVPAESAVQGTTLWIVGAWMVCGMIWLTGIQRGAFPRFRLDAIDAAVALWIGGQIASTLALVFSQGDKRSAVNTAWEWIGVGLVWLLLRHALTDASYRRSLVQATIVCGAVVAGLGLHQPYISQPQIAAEYGPLFDRLRTATPAESISVRHRLAQDGIPTEGPALTLFEKRLRDSREPLGLFALANTLGGCLAVCLILVIGQIFASWRGGVRWTGLLPLFAFVAVIGWCLLLTKSRTAWLGTIAGTAMLVAPGIRFARPYRRGFAVGFAILAIAAIVLARFGGLDQQVLSEAPKSLSYRLQYWQATTRMIADHPWLGIGPGNFRQAYLKYKLPEASEEISDPHNMLFDVAATGGVPSLIGLALFLLLIATKSMTRARIASRDTASMPVTEVASKAIELRPAIGHQDRRAFWWAGLSAFVSFASLLAFEGEWEDRILCLAVAWFAAAGWLQSTRETKVGSPEVSRDLADAAFASFVTLGIHLLGAGGIAMPGVSQWLMMLAAISIGSRPETAISPVPLRPSQLPVFLGMLALVVAVFGLGWTALVPVMKCRGYLRQGDFAVTSRRFGPASAKETYEKAAAADKWSPEPWQRLFELATANEIQSNDSLEAAVKDLHEVLARDPLNFWGLRAMGKLYLSRWKVGRDRRHAENAVDWLSRAHRYHPTNSDILADLATSLEAVGNRTEAMTIAKRAIDQDQIYRSQGHIDRFLPEYTLSRLKQMVPDDSPR